MQDTGGLARIVLAPVAHLKRSVRAVRLGDHRLTAAGLVVRVEIIGLRAVGILFHCHVGCVQHIGYPTLIQQVAVGITLALEDDAIITPAGQVVDRGGPYHLVPAAVLRLQHVVRSVDIHPVLAGLVRVLKQIGFTVGNKLPKRQIRVLGRCPCHTN